MVDADRALSASDAAWLVRVNDDTVRKWFRQPDLAVDSDGNVLFSDFARWCAQHRKPQVRPLWLLNATPDQIEAELSGLSSASPSDFQADVGREASSTELDELRLALSKSRQREAALRLALREKLAGSTHSRSDASASDRALGRMLDVYESDAGPEVP